MEDGVSQEVTLHCAGPHEGTVVLQRGESSQPYPVHCDALYGALNGDPAEIASEHGLCTIKTDEGSIHFRFQSDPPVEFALAIAHFTVLARSLGFQEPNYLT